MWKRGKSHANEIKAMFMLYPKLPLFFTSHCQIITKRYCQYSYYSRGRATADLTIFI